MNETTFENAKAGDRVWSVEFGWGTIEFMEAYGLMARFDKGKFSYDKCGKGLGNNQSLFWDEIKITPPPRPKRKVKKTIEAWANIYPYRKDPIFRASRETSDSAADYDRIACVHLTGEYEVEE